MTRLERLGMSLAELIRREHDLGVELEDTKKEIDQTIDEIRSAPSGILYESTSEQPLVRPYVEKDATEVLTAITGMSPIVGCPAACLYHAELRRHAHTADDKVHFW